MRKVQVIAGIPIDDLTLDQALDRVAAYIASGQPHQIATVNADFCVKAWDDPELRHILQSADMLTPDGMPLVWSARLLGVPLEGRVTGVDLVPAMARQGAEEGWKFYFLGARPGIAARAAEALTAQHPGLQIVGVYSPPVSSVVEMDDQIVDQIRDLRPDVLLVAFGNPKQEKWIHMHLNELNVPVSIGVGGTFDFIAGATRRAPEWMQHAGLEWLFRLLQEPRRLWRRYVVDIVHFGRFFARQWWMQRRGQSLPQIVPSLTQDTEREGLPVVELAGALTMDTRDAATARIEKALKQSPKLVLDMSAVTFVDSTGMGMLVDLTRRARAAGGDLRLAAVPAQVAQTLRLLRLDAFLLIDSSLQDSLAALSQPVEQPSAPQQVARWVVLTAPDRLDVNTALNLRKQGEQSLAQCPYLIVDLSATAYLDSAGIASLLALHRRAQNTSGELRLVALQPPVRRTLDLAQVSTVLTSYPTLENATGERV